MALTAEKKGELLLSAGADKGRNVAVAQHIKRATSAERNYRLCTLSRQRLNHKYKHLVLKGAWYRDEEFREEQARCVG